MAENGDSETLREIHACFAKKIFRFSELKLTSLMHLQISCYILYNRKSLAKTLIQKVSYQNLRIFWTHLIPDCINHITEQHTIL